MIHLWPISVGICLEIPKPAPFLWLGNSKNTVSLLLAKSISASLSGTAFKTAVRPLQVIHKGELVLSGGLGVGGLEYNKVRGSP